GMRSVINMGQAYIGELARQPGLVEDDDRIAILAYRFEAAIQHSASLPKISSRRRGNACTSCRYRKGRGRCGRPWGRGSAPAAAEPPALRPEPLQPAPRRTRRADIARSRAPVAQSPQS